MKTLLLALVLVLSGLALTAPAAEENDIVLKFPNANVSDVLALYGRITGKKIICDNTVQGLISLTTDSPVSREKAAELIEKAFYVNGFTLIDSGSDAVAVLGLGKPARGFGAPLYSKPEELPQGERVFSYLLKLQHANAQEMVGFLQQYIPPTNNISFTPSQNAQAIVVTGPTSIVRNVIQLVAALDVPPVRPPAPRRPLPPPISVEPAPGGDGKP
jgi:general secretion pathway protein D